MDKPRLFFYDEIARNKRKSFILIFVILLVLLSLIYVISFAFAREYAFLMLILGTILSIIYVVGGYYKSADLAVLATNSKPAPKSEYRMYHHIVEGLSIAAGIPKPKLYVMKDPSINAFASGRDPKHAIISVTTGALEKLNKQELEGVLAHEISHILNYDIRFMTLAAVLVGMVAIISEIFLRSLFWSSLASRDERDSRASLIFVIIGIALAIIAPIVVFLVQLAISRSREYGADSTAVKIVRSPTGLINALKRIKENRPMRVSGAVAPLFISNPLKSEALFSTHPPIEDRIRRLQRM